MKIFGLLLLIGTAYGMTSQGLDSDANDGNTIPPPQRRANDKKAIPKLVGEPKVTSKSTLQSEEEADEEEANPKGGRKKLEASGGVEEPPMHKSMMFPLSFTPVGQGDEDDGESGEPGPTAANADPNGAGENFIVGGYTAHKGAVPYIATIQLKVNGTWYHICGGVLISANKVLTAAHCLYYWYFYYYEYYYEHRVGLGWHNLRKDLYHSQAQTFYIYYAYIHPRFSFYKDVSPHDIAIITLDGYVTYSARINPIQLAPKYLYCGYYYYVKSSGWGKKTGRYFDGGYPALLQTMYQRPISQDLCSRFWSVDPSADVRDSMICAIGDPYDYNSACAGDSGGPMVCKGYLVGLISWGDYYCNGCLPTVGTRIASYRRWIRNNIDYYYYYKK